MFKEYVSLVFQQLPNFSMYQGQPAHIAHMKVKSNMPQFFMPDELKMEILNRNALTMAHIDLGQNIGELQQKFLDNWFSFICIHNYTILTYLSTRYLTRDQKAAGLSLTSVTALCPWARMLKLA